MRDKLVLAGALLATIAVYWIGLHGPFILDDAWNFRAVSQWANGQASWQYVVFGNTSGPLGRPLSMASFLVSAAQGGYAPFAFKLGNLVVHLLCGVMAWQVLRHALRLDPRLSTHAKVTASLLAAIWLLHPLNASTVLYAVQRMAQLSALFVLAATWAYLAARAQLAAGRTQRALLGLFVLVPLLVVAGLLSKENAVVAPLLFLVLELAYYTGRPAPATASPRSRAILGVFYTAVLVVPFLAGMLFKLSPAKLLAGYAVRDFTLYERLLTQARALMDYIGLLLLPRGPRMGVFNDDYVLSTGLLSPPSTLLCLLALAAITVAAIALRKRAPGIFAGWFFFLAAHSTESTIVPLELYFEHRNYLPAVGLWLAVAATAEYATRQLRASMDSRQRLGIGVAAAFIAVLALGTFGRASVWADEGRIYGQALAMHPDSPRAITVNFEYALQHNDARRAQYALQRFMASPDPSMRLIGALSRIRYGCLTGGASPDDVALATQLAQPKASILVHLQLEALIDLGPPADCGKVTPLMLARMTDAIADASTGLSDGASRKWRLRVVASRLFARAGRWDLALEQAKLAWQRGAEAPAGAFLVRAYAQNGQFDDARRVLAETQARIDPGNIAYVQGMQGLREFVERMASKAAAPPASTTPAG
jgi:hypothetical protein